MCCWPVKAPREAMRRRWLLRHKYFIAYHSALIANVQIFQAVLLTALGRSSNVPHDASVGAGLLSKSVSGLAAASAFQAVHADNSLAGIYIVAPVNHIEKAVRNAAQTIKSLTLSNLEGRNF